MSDRVCESCGGDTWIIKFSDTPKDKYRIEYSECVDCGNELIFKEQIIRNDKSWKTYNENKMRNI